jgi:hypothetical protein
MPVPVPKVPVVPAAKRLLHTVTSPVRKVVKKLPIPKLPAPKLPAPKLPGGLGLPSESPSGPSSQPLRGVANKALRGL